MWCLRPRFSSYIWVRTHAVHTVLHKYWCGTHYFWNELALKEHLCAYARVYMLYMYTSCLVLPVIEMYLKYWMWWESSHVPLAYKTPICAIVPNCQVRSGTIRYEPVRDSLSDTMLPPWTVRSGTIRYDQVRSGTIRYDPGTTRYDQKLSHSVFPTPCHRCLWGGEVCHMLARCAWHLSGWCLWHGQVANHLRYIYDGLVSDLCKRGIGIFVGEC